LFLFIFIFNFLFFYLIEFSPIFKLLWWAAVMCSLL
jgi:hypothetical protein